MAAVGHLGQTVQRDRVDPRALGGEPALERQIFGQRPAFDALGVCVVQRGGQPPVARRQGHEIGQHRRDRDVPGRGLVRGKLEPVEPVGRQHHQIGQLADRRKGGGARQFDRHLAGIGRKVDLCRLGLARQVGDAEHRLGLVVPKIGEDLAIARIEQFDLAPAEQRMALAHRDHPLHPVQKRGGRGVLRLDVDRLETVHRVLDRRQVELLGVGAAEPGIAVGRPLHRRAHAVAVP